MVATLVGATLGAGLISVPFVSGAGTDAGPSPSEVAVVHHLERVGQPPPVPPTTAPPPTTPLAALPSLDISPAPPGVAAAPAAKVTPARSDTGVASWFEASTGTCAHRTLPFGAVVRVIRLQNGAVATCTVADRGPTSETGRLIDLSVGTFEELALTDTGLIDVRIEW